ncbi:SMP-30/gluconolactonase/LRE family protein [Xinfangfangia sp. D13-10-4-6]|uniref:SMP-30/gluconolactonase/LRE family protein n=1 Tax=Pseudogemmobacter hezensis TaxID=2737662 RepID=UPI00155281A0|nr:SMP-30/gluconolactonase/LRE family protein [Pseudogemmobacter hezensis]NPD14725.1 SMP-30/gluconolactonase/LRE family protein [Pseudogemmobacter hezensis]
MSAPTCIAPSGDRCGEAATWSAAEAALYWVDINRFLIHRLDEASGAVRSWFFDQPVTALALAGEGCLLVALGDRLIWWWPATDRRQDHGFQLSGAPHLRLNDGRADPLGNFWVGSMKNNVNADGSAGEVAKGQGSLYRIAPDGSVSQWRHGLGIPNTLCWSPEGTTFYFGDTLEDTIFAWDFDPASGDISNERVFFAGAAAGAGGRGLPDGSTIDAGGYLWNCRYGGGAVLRIAPDGRLAQTIPLPVSNVTTCTFGGADLRTLYITTASAGAGPGERLAGGLFAIRTEVPGLPENHVHRI